MTDRSDLPLDTTDAATPPAESTPRPAPPVYTVETLRDPIPWAKPIRLDGVLERQRFSPMLTAVLAFMAGFLLYQIAAVFPPVISAFAAVEDTTDATALISAAMGDPRGLILGNTLGQFVGFCFFVLFVAWLHSHDTKEFLRIRRIDGKQLLLGAIGWVAIVPLVSWLGEVNALLPVPEFFEELEAQQTDLIESILGANFSLWFVLLMVAVTPAICEEVMFRGYLQRQVERRFGVVWSIIAIGIFFGAFHLRPTQLLPLATLGIYLGFSVWVSGSLWLGIVVHFLNNGLAAVVSDYATKNPEALSLESLNAPWYLAVVSALGVTAIVIAQLRRRETLLASRPVPVSPPDPPLSS